MRANISIFTLSLFVAFSMNAQHDTSNIVFFDNRFQAEREVEFASFYGTPKKIGDNRYEVIFYTMAGQKFAMGEYLGSNLKNRNGVFVRFDADGKITMSVNYRRGMMQGTYQRWHNNGVLADSGEMEGNYSLGIWKSWHPNGQLKDLRNYRKMKSPRNVNYSMLDGEYRSWDETGKLKDSGFYKEGLKTGVWIEWVENGEMRSLGVYKKGWRDGDWRYYDKSGKFLYIRRYRKNHYDRNGELIRVNN